MNHWSFRTYLELGALPSAVPRARRHTSQVLRKWGLAEIGESAELVVSELITNAIRASCQPGCGSRVRLWLFSNGASVVIKVWDSSPEPPQPARAGPADEDGRGLLIVQALATSWNSHARDGGKIVWAVLQFSPLHGGSGTTKRSDSRHRGRKAALRLPEAVGCASRSV